MKEKRKAGLMVGCRGRVVRVASGIAFCFSFSVAACPRDARAAEPQAVQTAEQLANRAYDEHAAGKYPEAIASYLKAYELSNAGVILFNVATIYDRKLHEREL